jgi:hypothetical protein
MRQDFVMDRDERPPVFPYQTVWEEYGPAKFIHWESLQCNADQYRILFQLADTGIAEIPEVTEAALDHLVEQSLKRLPSPTLSSRLYLLAGWQVEGQFRAQIGIDLASQRRAIKRLQSAAEEFRHAANRLSGHVQIVLEWVHLVEPDRLLPEGRELDLFDLGLAAHDLSLAAARMYEDTKPERTGRRLQMRRDTTVRLAAEAIEEETGEPITMSRGNTACPAPHFTNAGGRLLRDFFKLVDPKTDERLIVQSLGRVRKRAELQKNSR